MPLSKPPLRLISRKSSLAMWQARFAAQHLRSLGYVTRIIGQTALADQKPETPLHEFKGKSAFVGTLERALLHHKADVAVHSLKDVGVRLIEPLGIAATLPRHLPGDVCLLLRSACQKQRKVLPSSKIIGSSHLAVLQNCCIATSSPRRAMLLAEAQADCTVVPIRGNVDTRLRKVLSGGYGDGLVLAAAALSRLALSSSSCRKLLRHFILLRLDPMWFTPSPTQGILALQGLTTHRHYERWQQLSCTHTLIAARVERKITEDLGGHCMLPLGCWAQIIPAAPPSQGGDVRIKVRTFLGAPSHPHRPHPLTARCAVEEVLETGENGEAYLSAENINRISHQTIKQLQSQQGHLIFEQLSLPLPWQG